jgi:hypothetical protein
MQTLRSELHLVPPRISAYISGLSLLPPSSSASYSDTPSFEHIENCLRLLDSFLLGQWASPTRGDENVQVGREALDEDRESGFAKELVGLCVVSELMTQSYDSKIGISNCPPCPI